MDTKDKKHPRPSSVTAFLALQPAIEDALRRGVRRCAFYEEHREALGTSYVQFTRYVRRYITAPSSQSKPSPRVENASTGSEKIQSPTQAPARAGPISTPAQTSRKFEFDPTRANKPGRAEELF